MRGGGGGGVKETCEITPLSILCTYCTAICILFVTQNTSSESLHTQKL